MRPTPPLTATPQRLRSAPLLHGDEDQPADVRKYPTPLQPQLMSRWRVAPALHHGSVYRPSLFSLPCDRGGLKAAAVSIRAPTSQWPPLSLAQLCPLSQAAARRKLLDAFNRHRGHVRVAPWVCQFLSTVRVTCRSHGARAVAPLIRTHQRLMIYFPCQGRCPMSSPRLSPAVARVTCSCELTALRLRCRCLGVLQGFDMTVAGRGGILFALSFGVCLSCLGMCFFHVRHTRMQPHTE